MEMATFPEDGSKVQPIPIQGVVVIPKSPPCHEFHLKNSIAARPAWLAERKFQVYLKNV